VPLTSFGSSKLPVGTNRPGCLFSAARDVSSETPITPISMPNRSISCSVTETGSEVGRSFGTFLNMYSAGNCMSLREERSFVCLRDEVVLPEPLVRESDHRVDDPVVRRHDHAETPPSVWDNDLG
jgi:hypothetical protein